MTRDDLKKKTLKQLCGLTTAEKKEAIDILIEAIAADKAYEVMSKLNFDK